MTMIWLCSISKIHYVTLYLYSSPAGFQPLLHVFPELLLDLFSWEDLTMELIVLWTVSGSLLPFEPRIVKFMHVVYENWHAAKIRCFHSKLDLPLSQNKTKQNPTNTKLKQTNPNQTNPKNPPPKQNKKINRFPAEIPCSRINISQFILYSFVLYFKEIANS